MSLRPEANGNIYFCVCLAGGNIYNICITRQTLWFVTIQTIISPIENNHIVAAEPTTPRHSFRNYQIVILISPACQSVSAGNVLIIAQSVKHQM